MHPIRDKAFEVETKDWPWDHRDLLHLAQRVVDAVVQLLPEQIGLPGEHVRLAHQSAREGPQNRILLVTEALRILLDHNLLSVDCVLIGLPSTRKAEDGHPAHLIGDKHISTDCLDIGYIGKIVIGCQQFW